MLILQKNVCMFACVSACDIHIDRQKTIQPVNQYDNNACINMFLTQPVYHDEYDLAYHVGEL